MKKGAVIILLLLGIVSARAQQGIKGQIFNQDGKPIPFATVYIESLRQGTTSNARGEFTIRLDPGKYVIQFQSLGYMTTVRKVTVTDNFITLDPKLHMQYYQIQEVRIIASGEDPAYPIMRKAIAMAPYYLNHVKYYKADLYLKGTLVINKIPKLLQRQIEKSDEEIDLKVGKLYLMESFNEIEFNAPKTYNQKVLSFQSNFPGAEGVSPMDYIKASLYQPEIEVLITPFSPAAFNHYDFEYQGSSFQAQYIINKIKVTPKRKSQQLMEGTLYIIEDLWCLHSADLENHNMVGDVRVQQLFAPIEDGIWMPVSHKIDVRGKMLGISADFDYGGSVRYEEVRENTELEKPDLIKDLTARNYRVVEEAAAEEQKEKAKTKNQQKIEGILKKEELSNRDMVRLSRLMEKETKEEKTDVEDLEIKKTTTYEIAEGAENTDTSLWEEIRTMPLTREEKISIRRMKERELAETGRISRRNDTIQAAEKQRKSLLETGNEILFGEEYRFFDQTLRVRHDGLINLSNLGFNTADGFHYGLSGRMIHYIGGNTEIRSYPYVGYNFSRKNIRWHANNILDWKGMKQARTSLRIGQESRDHNTTSGINPRLNLFTSLLLKKNYLKLYDRSYFQISHEWEVRNGFYIDFMGRYEDRRMLRNTSDFSLFQKDKEYTANIPKNPYLLNLSMAELSPDADNRGILADHKHYDLNVELRYTPRQRYRIYDNRKVAAGSDYPTFTVSYQHGWNESFNKEEMRSFGHLKTELFQSKDLGAFYQYHWRVRAGVFFQGENLYFPDYKHFNTQNILLLLNDYADGFFLLNDYEHSSPEYYFEAHGKYTTPYFLLKLLPFLSNKLMRENLHLKYMYTPGNEHYTEIGYGLSELFLLGQVNVFTGFRNLKYEGAGIRIVLNLQ